MTNKFRTLVAAAAVALLVPASANASTFSGRVTSFSPTSITVMDKEMVTVGINDNTLFTKLITQKPWQQDTALTAKALRLGAFVVDPRPHEQRVRGQLGAGRPGSWLRQ